MKQNYFQPQTFTVPLSSVGALCVGTPPAFPEGPIEEEPISGDV